MHNIKHILIIIPMFLMIFIFSMSEINSETKTSLIKVFPVSGIPGTDIRQIMAYYDHDNKKATKFSSLGLGKNNIMDYMRGKNSYDEHMGTDIGIIGFEDQDIGVPVVAVTEGIVKKTLDGVFDRETNFPAGKQGNFILIDHGRGITTYYNHLRKGSICVKNGDRVMTGQQIGLMGSSGASTWPHLHFEWRENGISVDPFSGPGNKNESKWIKQPAYDYPMIIADCGLYHDKGRKKLPFISKRESFAMRGRSKKEGLKLWITVLNVSKKRYTRKWELISPGNKYRKVWRDVIDGSKRWHGLGREIWQYYYRTGFSKKASAGTWTMKIYHNNAIAKIIHFTVSDNKPDNRPPLQPTGGSISPRAPEVNDYIQCRVDFQKKALDPDLDRVRFRFEWRLNGTVVRDVTNATRLDYFPAQSAKPGSTLTCSVFASDGRKESTPLRFKLKYRQAR